jgi:hypothetical protein
MQYRRGEEQKRRQHGRIRHAARDVHATLKHRAEEASPPTGGAHVLGYNVLVKLKIDDLLEQEGLPMPVSADGAHPRDGDGEALRASPMSGPLTTLLAGDHTRLDGSSSGQ